MDERLVQRFVRVLKPDILADDPDRHLAFEVLVTVEDILPCGQFGRLAFEPEMLEQFGVQTTGVILQGHSVDARRIEGGYDRFLSDVAEIGDLLPFPVRQRMLAPAQEHIRLDAETGQFANGVLRRLGLQLARGGNVRDEGNVNEGRSRRSKFVLQLPHRLDERQALDVADRSTDLAQDEVVVALIVERECLDGVRDVRNDLDSRTEIVAAPFLGDDIAIDPARRDVVALPRRNAGEALVMAEVEVGLRAVIGDEDLTMLIRAHRARIDIEIGIELADTNLVPARLKKRRQTGSHETFTERRNHAAGDENIPRHGSQALSSRIDSEQAINAQRRSPIHNEVGAPWRRLSGLTRRADRCSQAPHRPLRHRQVQVRPMPTNRCRRRVDRAVPLV